MDELKYKKREVIEYLLGSLPEADAEKFDELSLTDDDFADALNFFEKDLVDAYVAGELAGATLETFKTHYLATPLRREKVRFAGAFQSFAEKTGSKIFEPASAEKSKPKKTIAAFFSALNPFAAPQAALRWSVAAALSAAVLGGSWIIFNRSGQPENQPLQARQNDAPATVDGETSKPFEKTLSNDSNRENEIAAANEKNRMPPPQNSETEFANQQTAASPPLSPKPPPAIRPIVASLVLAPSPRGDNQIANLSISGKTAAVAARLQLEADDYAAYRVALTDESGGVTLWRSGTIKAFGKGENKYLKARFPAGLLKSKIYLLVVSGVNAKSEVEIITNYTFRSTRK